MTVGYICKYTPVKLLESMGVECRRIEPWYIDNEVAEALMHPNMCTYVKGVLSEVVRGGYDGIVLVNCCDSARRLYDVLKSAKEDMMVYMLDLPRKSGDQAVAVYACEIKKLIQAFADFYGKKFNVQDFKEYMWIEQNATQANKPKVRKGVSLAIMGARCSSHLVDLIKDAGADEVLNYTCTGDLLEYTSLFDKSAGEQEMIEWYAGCLMRSIPCMRMADIDRRRDVLEDIMANVDGIVYHTIKFCEFYSYEYSYIKDNWHFPILKIESDFTRDGEGQLMTRVSAFVESLRGKGEFRGSLRKPKPGKRIVAGVDSGSLSTDVVILDEDYNILSYSVVPTGASIVESANKAFSQAIEKAGISRDDVSFVVSTGYGRINIPFADKQVTEITCHGKGAYFLNNSVRTIIDIGGQDSKVIRLDDHGNVVDFVMNDRCSAGTGRFLEVMAKALEIPLEEMGEEAQKATEEINITSICTVFAESEVISLIAQNKKRADIVKGLHNSVASKTIGLLDRVGRKGAYMMTGGVAKNRGVVEAIEQKIGEKVYVPEEPQIVGALGAAILALQE
ncbi:benzoyl-CoA reductase, bcr type, subunit D [Caldanaerobius fijiensis DSM 17918]|uniref:Benzoyl-CoA reductase, bcr type, subunit D n=1 Tax=Caldanaerobius fijiensis DSM 17918 TaxID=1121256 RepID=A0A1M5BSK0_9THEO|nr:acyl-CoA dehydratase activase [Caldanaerobius fijiensis]SHF45247.1 benzoyl-CoA reductase, bcr type, subunit D [Caldanaerobius fijiensis DSM 17918]